MNKKTSKVRFLALSAVIAALYAVLTYAAAAMNLAFGAVQFRFSEALTVLPAFTPAAIPGLAVGCLISNLASPLGVVDWVFGTLATLLAGIFSYLVRNIRWKEIPVLAPLPPVIFNALIVGFEVACLADNGTFAFGNLSLAGFIAGAVSVGIGELIVGDVGDSIVQTVHHGHGQNVVQELGVEVGLRCGRAADDGAAPHEDQRTHVGINLFRARPEKVGRSL